MFPTKDLRYFFVWWHILDHCVDLLPDKCCFFLLFGVTMPSIYQQVQEKNFFD